jgi:hypothetical protein
MSSTKSLTPYRPVAVDDLVRLGRDNDGGYVIPKRVIAATQVLFGFGISTDWSFETDYLAQNPRARLVAIDGTVGVGIFRGRAVKQMVHAAAAVGRGRWSSARSHLESAGEMARAAGAFRRFFSDGNRQIIYRLASDADSHMYISWESVKRAAGAPPAPGAPTWFVKMDIEGGEYRVLPDLARDADSLLGMVIEFHDTDLMWERFTEAMDALCRHQVVVHVHGNNLHPLIKGTRVPRLLEVTLMHRSLLTSDEATGTRTRAYPLPGLDQPNVPGQPDYALEF